MFSDKFAPSNDALRVTYFKLMALFRVNKSDMRWVVLSTEVSVSMSL